MVTIKVRKYAKRVVIVDPTSLPASIRLVFQQPKPLTGKSAKMNRLWREFNTINNKNGGETWRKQKEIIKAMVKKHLGVTLHKSVLNTKFEQYYKKARENSRCNWESQRRWINKQILERI